MKIRKVINWVFMRKKEDMQVNVAGLRRNIKNLAHNYSDAQVKVREATSNDPWGPSSTLMTEIADLTYNVVAFTEIMQMIWKRLNDHGRNWRHVYKALLLLEYLIKTGSEKVGQQCKENIFAIQTLRDFQHTDEGKDQGVNVREKAKQLVILLRDEERLKNERARALKAKERLAQTASGFGSDMTLDATSPSSPSFQSRAWGSGDMEAPNKVDIMCARPTTAGEEELQLQLALAMSREEAEQEEQKRRSDDVRLQLAISQSQNEFSVDSGTKSGSHMLDLLDVNLTPPELPPANNLPIQDPWAVPLPPPRPQTLNLNLSYWPAADPWSVSSSTTTNHSDPWSPIPVMPVQSKPSVPVQPNNPWKAHSPTPLKQNDPWSPATEPSPAISLSSPSNTDLDEFDIISNRDRNNINNNKSGGSPNPFDMKDLGDGLEESTSTMVKRSPHSFLGENSALVNLDNLVTKPVTPTPLQTPQPPRTVAANPFSPLTPLQPMRAPYPATSQGIVQPMVPQPNPFLS
ncbi:epsin-2 isoform X3 [Cimex lectularius]|uniref:ENTH domain-containing protein n=1 Tax=Cimex lectularius TaxID=79782 RepID=A0A8I6S252_CIMLE|nr:epsin-2 isoform X3 [Cimex lectularius]